MRVFVRTDASLEIGSGHVMRCLTLADALTAQGAAVSFISYEYPGNLFSLIEMKGYTVHRLPLSAKGSMPQGDGTPHQQSPDLAWTHDAEQTGAVIKKASSADWLVVDHYDIDSRWEKSLRSIVRHIMVIDDLANREHDCDIILDQNYYKGFERRYDNLVSNDCKKMLGPGYSLLRAEFSEARTNLKQRDGQVRRILVYFGAIDLSDETSKTLHALKMLNRNDIAVDVIVGTANPHRHQLQALCSEMPTVRFHKKVPSIAQLMVAADLFIGAGGTTTWERCFLGLPSIVLILADNQLKLTMDTATYGASICLGRSGQVTVECLVAKLREVTHAPELLRKIGHRATSLMQPINDKGIHPAVLAMVGEH